jgi:YVTN family beta-propeller protein
VACWAAFLAATTNKPSVRQHAAGGGRAYTAGLPSVVPALNLLSVLLALLAALWCSSAAAADKPPIFVLNSLDASISVIDPASFTELKRIPTGKEPHHLYLTPDEKSLIVANALSDSLTLVDPKTGEVQRTLTKIIDPYHLRFSPDMKWLVTAANRLDHVDVYHWQPQDAATPLKLAGRVRATRTPSHLSIDSKSTTIYASMQDSDELMAIELATQKPRWKIAIGKLPADVYLTPDDRLLMVALTGDEFVEVYDVTQAAPKLVKRIQTGAGAHAFRSRGDGRHVFVSNRVANTISMVDIQTLSVVSQLPAPGGPDCMDLLADGKTLMVTSRWARKLSFIDIEKKQVVRQVAVGRSPHGVWTLDHAPRR